MDLSSLINNDTAECVIVDPRTGKNTDAVITVYGRHTAESQSAIAKAGDLADINNFANYLADVTVSWVNVEFEGKPLKFDRKNALDIYNHTGQIVAIQIASFLGAQGSFLPKR
tara:strand:+ start:219 stop:557 length:339 start_codon:yes stop_codon:yes gene_type:complete